MEAKGSNFLKVTGIIMIVGGSLGIIISLLAIAGVATLAAMGLSSGMLYASVVISVIGSVIELVAGIMGVKNCNAPEKANTCMICGISVIACSLISTIISVIAGNGFPFTSFIIGMILPVLYIVGAAKNKA
ncbi:MAG: hypothetical protein K2H01_03410 [Ruminococcus sp.]|nr:hypothetical protein [Ruminococcus sp.]